jgi:hypothetical protein
MKLLFIHQNFPGQFKHLAPALAQQGHTVVDRGANARAFAVAHDDLKRVCQPRQMEWVGGFAT